MNRVVGSEAVVGDLRDPLNLREKLRLAGVLGRLQFAQPSASVLAQPLHIFVLAKPAEDGGARGCLIKDRLGDHRLIKLNVERKPVVVVAAERDAPPGERLAPKLLVYRSHLVVIELERGGDGIDALDRATATVGNDHPARIVLLNVELAALGGVQQVERRSAAVLPDSFLPTKHVIDWSTGAAPRLNDVAKALDCEFDEKHS